MLPALPMLPTLIHRRVPSRPCKPGVNPVNCLATCHAATSSVLRPIPWLARPAKVTSTKYCHDAVADNEPDLIAQFAAVLAVGSHAVWEARHAMVADLYRALPESLRNRVTLMPDACTADIDAALHHGDAASLRALLAKLAAREGMIVSVTALPTGDHAIPLERLVIERAVSTNTAAAGGNASLMTMA